MSNCVNGAMPTADATKIVDLRIFVSYCKSPKSTTTTLQSTAGWSVAVRILQSLNKKNWTTLRFLPHYTIQMLEYLENSVTDAYLWGVDTGWTGTSYALSPIRPRFFAASTFLPPTLKEVLVSTIHHYGKESGYESCTIDSEIQHRSFFDSEVSSSLCC